MAKEDVRNNVIGLANIDLDVINNDDGCHMDTVMKTFINYYVKPDVVLGVLGPPCSETVEPIASKQLKPIISYSYMVSFDLEKGYTSHQYMLFFRIHISSSRLGLFFFFHYETALCLQK